MRGFCLFVLFCCTGLHLFGQGQKISGIVKDAISGEPQPFANVVVKGTTQGVVTDLSGAFSIEVDFKETDNAVLQISYVGYETIEVPVVKNQSKLKVNLNPAVIMGKEVVISASRVSENIMESPIAVQKINSKAILESSSGDFYQSLGNLKGVDVVTSSMGFKAINMRGFNTTSPVRSVQFIDEMDNQAPGLNFPVGNMVGASDLDIESIEIISGAASAMYGANAFQGVVDIKTKDPYRYPGMDVMIKGGTRDYMDAQLRYARTIGKDNKFGFKINAAYLSAKDWRATDSVANRYGDIETEVDLTKIIVQKQFDQNLSQSERDDFLSLNSYLKFYPSGYPGTLKIKAPGYMENELAEPNVRSVKMGLGAYYKISDSLQLQYMYKLGNGTSIYQGTNRYSINNILFQQHKVQLDGKNFQVKAYTTMENAGDSYDIVFTGINISKYAISEYVGEYLGNYFDKLEEVTGGYDLSANTGHANQAHQYAYNQSQSSWLQSGTATFDSLKALIIDDPDLQTGSKFVDKSSLQHVDGQYRFTIPGQFDALCGASLRRYAPRSFGTIFSDTLVNAADTLENGRFDTKAEFTDLSLFEYGAFIQVGKKALNDKLKILGSLRFDKNQNYDLQYSPRLSFMYKAKDNYFRVSVQQAFRAPTLQDQYLWLDLGPIRLQGNLNGYQNFYSLSSVQAFNAMVDSIDNQGNYMGAIRPELLDYDTILAIQPERVQTLELGYRGIITDGFYADITVYANRYKDFIGSRRIYQMLNDSFVVSQESGVNAVLTHSESNPTIGLLQVPVNAKTDVFTYGATVGLVYYLNSKYLLKGNYTYSVIDTSGIDKDIIPGFNTPKHKFNMGVEAKNIWKGVGGGIQLKWTDRFYWQSPFGDGWVKAYTNVDLQLNYLVKRFNTTARIGVSNLLGQNRIEAYGSPTIGRFIYGSLHYHMDW